MPRRRGEREDNDDDLTLRGLLNDRVKLLQHVFAAIRTSEMKTLIPDCVKHLPLSSIKELCLEELLGISTKRLAALVAGERVPSDTESSSDGQRAPISLDSISSDEVALTNTTGKYRKKKRKHKKHSKKKSSKGKKADRAGLTVLELLELQARARAIRAQLQAETQPDTKDAACTSVIHELSASEEDDVLIKEEPLEVVELSSSDDDDGEKPKVVVIDKTTQHTTKIVKRELEKKDASPNTSWATPEDTTVIAPKAQANTTSKIKLMRRIFVSNTVVILNKDKTIAKDKPDAQKQAIDIEVSISSGKSEEPINISSVKENAESSSKDTDAPALTTDTTATTKSKRKKNKRTRAKSPENISSEKDDSDQDEILLQLSDSEKMDLLGDYYPKKKQKQLSSNSEESATSTSEDETELISQDDAPNTENILKQVILDNGGNSTKYDIKTEIMDTTNTVSAEDAVNIENIEKNSSGATTNQNDFGPKYTTDKVEAEDVPRMETDSIKKESSEK